MGDGISGLGRATAVLSRKRAAVAEREFRSVLREDGWPSWGCYCKHGMPGGLYCEWCGWVDKLPAGEKLSGQMGERVP